MKLLSTLLDRKLVLFLIWLIDHVRELKITSILSNLKQTLKYVHHLDIQIWLFLVLSWPADFYFLWKKFPFFGGLCNWICWSMKTALENYLPKYKLQSTISFCWIKNNTLVNVYAKHKKRSLRYMRCEESNKWCDHEVVVLKRVRQEGLTHSLFNQEKNSAVFWFKTCSASWYWNPY